MQIFVKFVDSTSLPWAADLRGRTVNLDTCATETIEAVKAKIQSQFPNVSSDQQELFNPPTRLDEPHQTLESLDIQSGTTLELRRKLRVEYGPVAPHAGNRHAPDQVPAKVPEADDLAQCLSGIREAQAIMRDKLSAYPSDVTRVLVMGFTGAGKSMLVNALVGNALKVVQLEDKAVVEAVSPLPELKIGHTLNSETTMLGRHRDAANKLAFWDCPGFFDSRGAVQDIVNGFAIDQLLQGNCRIKVLLVIEECDVTKKRAENCKRQLEKLAALFPNREQLHAMTTLVITKLPIEEDADGHHGLRPARHPEHLANLRHCGHEKEAPYNAIPNRSLGPFLSQNASTRIFSGGRWASASMVGKPFVIPDVEAIIEALKHNPVQCPEHKIHLDCDAKSLFYEVVRKSASAESILQGLVQLCQQLFRTSSSLTDIKQWFEWMNCLLQQSSSPDALEKMTDIAAALEHGLPSSLAAAQLTEIETKANSLRDLQVQQDFCLKVDPDLKVGNPKATLEALLRNAHQELSYKVKHMEEVAAQQEQMQRLEDDLEREHAERKKEFLEYETKMQSIQDSCEQKVAEIQDALDKEVENGKKTKEEAAAALKDAIAEQSLIRQRELDALSKQYFENERIKQQQIDELKATQKRTQEQHERDRKEDAAKFEEMKAEQREREKRWQEEQDRQREREEARLREKQKELQYVMLPLYVNGVYQRDCRVHPDDVDEWRHRHS